MMVASLPTGMAAASEQVDEGEVVLFMVSFLNSTRITTIYFAHMQHEETWS